MTTDTVVPALDNHAPRSRLWPGRRANRSADLIFDLNRTHRNIHRLRNRALKAIENLNCTHLPRRFWVIRGGSEARNRELKNEIKLIKQLRMIGFDSLYFEDFSPLEQIALMANAEVMVSHHGAGFANMLFTSPNTHVIEIGSPQTAAAR